MIKEALRSIQVVFGRFVTAHGRPGGHNLVDLRPGITHGNYAIQRGLEMAANRSTGLNPKLLQDINDALKEAEAQHAGSNRLV